MLFSPFSADLALSAALDTLATAASEMRRPLVHA